MKYSRPIDNLSLASAILIFLAAVSCFACAHQKAEEPPERIQALYGIAEELRTAILQKDIEALLKYIVIGPDGFESYAQARILFDPETPSIRCLIFDTKCWLEELREHHGETNPYRTSLLDFFQQHPNLRVRIRLFDPPNHRAHVLYIVTGSQYDATYPSWADDPNSLKEWGKQFIAGCMKYTDSGWRYDSPDAGIFFCGGD
jgi:hypothetical protein